MQEFIPITSVEVFDDRIRQDFNEEALTNLARSLYTKGYIHPITLNANSNVLVAGENRYRAHRLLLDSNLTPRDCPFGDIPVTRIGDLSPDNLYEAELEENLLRTDLTWQEEAQAIAKLHKLRQSQQIDWSFADTANELMEPGTGSASGGQRVKVTESLVLADNLDDPLVANAKTKKDAIKAVRDRNRHAARAQAVEDFEDLLTNEDPNNDQSTSDSQSHILVQGNYFEYVTTIPDGSFDIVLCDPPYGIDIHRKGTFDSDVHEYDDSKDYFDEIVQSLASESYRVTKPQAHAYVFCDIRRWPDLDQAFFLAGWDIWARPLIWHKGNIGSFANSDIGPRSTYECILYATKGHKLVEHNDMDVILVNQSTRSDHPANKPVELFSNLLMRSAFPGQKVIDFFCGSGPIFPAAQQHNLIATGIELNPKYHAIAHERLMETKK